MNVDFCCTPLSQHTHDTKKKETKINDFDQESILQHPDGHKLNIDKLYRIMNCLQRLTLPYIDSNENTLQIWKINPSTLIGTVQNKLKQIIIIPASKIRFLSEQVENYSIVIKQLERETLKKWDIVYNSNILELDVWPHFLAAGKSWVEDPENVVDKSPYKNMTKDDLIKHFTDKGYQFVGNKDTGIGSYIHPLTKDEAHIDPRGQHKWQEPNHVDVKDKNGKKRYYYKDPFGTRFFKKESQFKRSPENKDFIQGVIKTKMQVTPAGKQFQENVQKEGLTKSFNSSHPDNPIGKGGSKEIGGVGCTVELIEGLFDTPESLFETEHSFFIPEFEGETPFTSQEMSQLVQELAMGIFVHGTVPFFSLHFNQNADLYPIVHPAYENTLVGQVFGMLDYYMKGYLNGGVFNETYVQEWQKNPTKIKVDEKILPELINFRSYTEQNLSGDDKEYLSVREMLKLMELDDLKNDSFEKTEFNFYDYTKFCNSFRIIAKQKSIDKAEYLFLINSDFEVQYTIEANPDYKKALEEYLHINGNYPKAYLNLIAAYEKMKKQIHNHMIKMPFCKKYFAMLGVINFFSYYFTTLKKHHKYPVLPKVNLKSAKCPALFPSLPVLTNRTEEFKISKYQVLNELLKNSYKIRCFITFFTIGLATSLNKYIEQLCWEDLLSNTSNDFKNEIFKNEDKFRDLCKICTSNFDLLNLIKSKYKDPNDSFDKFRETLLITISNEPTIITKMTKNLFILPDEQKSDEIELGKKIVGGCGMYTSPLKAQKSFIGSQILNNHWKEIHETPNGQFAKVSIIENSAIKGAIFTLGLVNIPFGYIQNSSDMEMLLTPIDDEREGLFDQMHAIVKCIVENDQEEFTKLLNKHDVNKIEDREQRSLLHHSVMVKNPFFTYELIKRGILITKNDAKNYQPIHYAAMCGNVQQLEFLINNDKNLIEAKSNQGATPLIIAIQNNSYTAVEYLISMKANIEVELINGYSTLHCAVHQGNIKIVKLVLENLILSNPVINVNGPINSTITPLMMACQSGSIEIAKYLVQKNASLTLIAKNGLTALEIAVKKNDLELCNLLARSLNDIIIEKAIKKSSLEINQVLAGLKGYLNYTNTLKETPLLMAIKYGNIPLALFILSKITDKKDLMVKNIFGESTLTLAIKGKFYSLLEELLNKKIEFEPFELFKNLLQTGYSGQNSILNKHLDTFFTQDELIELTLIAAKSGNYLAISKLLLPRKVDLSKIIGNNDWTIDHYLAKSDGIFLFRMRYQQTKNLLQPLLKDNGKTLAYIAGENKSLRVFEFILDNIKATSDSTDNHFQGRHLFYSVLESGSLEGIKLFIRKMGNTIFLNQPIDSIGTYPVHLAAKIASKEILEYLYNSGAKLNVVDSLGHNPLFYAIKRKDKDIVKFLIDDAHKNTITADSLYIAASFKKDLFFNMLLSAGANLNNCSNSKENNALMIAIEKHDLRAFMRLVKSKASLKTKNLERWSPFQLACHEGQFEMALVILKLLPRQHYEEVNGNNALHLACKNGHEHCVDLLIKNGFSTDVENSMGQKPSSLAKDDFGVMAAIGLEGAFELYREYTSKALTAIREKNLIPIIEELFKWPLNTNFTIILNKTFYRGTILHIALNFCGKNQEIQQFILNTIKSKYFDPNLKDSKGNSYAHLMIKNEIDPTQFKIFNLEISNDNGETPLHIAAKGNKDCLKKLIQSLPLKLNPVDRRGRTPLFYAIKSNQQENVTLFAKNGANLDVRDDQGITPLLMTCKIACYPIIRSLVENGANVNQEGFNQLTPLMTTLKFKNDDASIFLIFNGAKLNQNKQIAHIAASEGKDYLLRFLKEQELFLTSINDQGIQPIHQAALKGRTSAMNYLTSLGISIETPIENAINENKKTEYFNGVTPILLAAKESSVEAVKWLLEHNANPEITTDSGLNILKMAFSNKPDNCQKIIELFKDYLLINDLKQLLPGIALAIEKDYIAPLQLLYDKGIGINTNLKMGLTGLHYASVYGSLASTEFLLTHGAKWDIFTENSETAIELAAANKSVEQFQMMLNFTNFPINHKNKKGETLMHLAARAGNLNHAMLLIDRKEDFDTQDVQGRTPLHLASENGFTDVVTLLMISGADPDVKTFFNSLKPEDVKNIEIKNLITNLRLLIKEMPKGSTVLHIAAKGGFSFILHLALNHFDVNKKNDLGKTALHYAATQGSLQNIRALLNQGANINEKDLDGIIPINMALDSNVAQFFLKAGALQLVNSSHANKEVI